MKGKPPKIDSERIKNAIKMDNYIVQGEDYIDFIKSEEDVKKIERMREILIQIKGVPWQNCVPEIEEYVNLHRQLIGGVPLKIITVPKNPQAN